MDLEEGAGVGEGVEVAEADVRCRAVAAEGVEVTAAHQDEFSDAESGGAASKCAHVVPLGYIVHHQVALYHIYPSPSLSFSLSFSFSISDLFVFL